MYQSKEMKKMCERYDNHMIQLNAAYKTTNCALYCCRNKCKFLEITLLEIVFEKLKHFYVTFTGSKLDIGRLIKL